MAGDAMTDHPASSWAIDGKLCLITGATSGIGAATAMNLAGRGAHVLLSARDPERGRVAAEAIRSAHPQAQVDVLTCDLARMDDVRCLARSIQDSYGRLDVLINNAGVVNFTRRTTVDGYEHTFAVNHLAPFLLTNLLRPALSVAGQARVLTVTSDNHKTVKSIPWDDLQSEHGYKPLQVYNRTKLMNIWFTQVLGASLGETQITANCVSPGFVRTRLARDANGAFALFIRLAAPFQSSADSAATHLVHRASSPELSQQTGRYYRKSQPAEPGGLGQEPAAASQLWRISAELTGVADASGSAPKPEPAQ